MVMTLRNAAVFVAASVAVSACGGGPGPLVTVGTEQRDDPGTTRDPPPNPRDVPGGACVVCDVNYHCTGPTSGVLGQNGEISLSTSSGMCQKALIDLLCSGALFNAMSCTGGGGGAFTCGSTTCSPMAAQGMSGFVSTPTSPPTGGVAASSSSSSGGPILDGG